MARRTYTDNGSVGYSDEALKALRRGEYGKQTNRKVQYSTSEDQVKAVQTVPMLKGMGASSVANDWESGLSRNKYSNGVDPARAREKYAQRLEEEAKVSNDENYVVKRDRYDKLMKDSRLANDIKTLAEVNYKNANQDATVSQEWADEYGAKAITGGLSKSQFLTQLSKRYELTPEELNDMALTFHTDANNLDVEQYGKQLEKIGKAEPVLGSAGSLIGTLGSGIEGMYNTAVGAITGDDRYLSKMFSTTKKSPREGAKQNIESGWGKGLYDIGMGIADMFTGAAVGSAPLVLAGNTANEAQESALNRGTGVRKASAYAGLSGAVDFVTNKIGLDEAKKLAVDSIKKSGIKQFLAKNAIASLGEAGENVIQDISQTFIDELINGKNSELRTSYDSKIANGMSQADAFKETAKEYAGQLLMSGATGFGMGSFMQGSETILPRIPDLLDYAKVNSNLGIVDPNIRAIVDRVPEANNVVAKAMEQAEGAKAEIDNLAKKIPETPEADFSDDRLTVDEMRALGLGDETIKRQLEIYNNRQQGNGEMYKSPTALNNGYDPSLNLTSEPGQLLDSNNRITPIADSVNNTAPDFMGELRAAFQNADPETKADMLVEGGYFRDMIEAGEAYRDGQLDAAVDDYLAKMESNGNPTPTKRTVDTNDYDRKLLKEQYNDDWDAMRMGIVEDYTGATGEKAKEYFDTLRSFTGGTSPNEKSTKILDEYVENAPTYQGKIGRGMHFNVGDGEYDKFMNKVREEGIVTLGKPSSWATDPETTRLYSHMGDDSVDSIEIVCNQNRTSTPINYMNLQGEDEVLSSSNASWTVLREETYERPNGAKKTVLYVAETGDKTPPKDAVIIPDDSPMEAANNLPAVDGVIPQRTMNESAGRNPQLTQQIGNEVPPTTPPTDNGNVPPTDDGTGISRVTTHSAKNAGVVTQDELDNDEVIKQITKYAKHNNETTLDNAKENVIKNGEQLLADFNSGKRSINSDQTVDESFLLLRNLTNQIEELGENAPDELRQQRYLLLSRLREAGTRYGQTIQAFAKWNNTADGAIVNGQKIVGDRVKEYKGRNQEQVKRNEKVAEAISKIGYDTEIRNEGSYSKPKATNDAEKSSRLLDRALRKQGYDGTMEAEPKAPKTHEQHRVEVENSIRKELGSVADQFTDNDFEYLTSLVENKVSADIIADEIEHRLNHGEWYTIDESTPVKKATSSKLAKVLKDMGDDSLKSKNKPIDNGYPKKSHATIVEEVTNTLQGEAAGLGLDTPTDIEFISTMIEEGVPNWQIEDEINHRLMTGEWYTLDESTEPKVPVDQKLRNALNSLVDTEEKPAPAELSFEEIRDRIKRTLDDEAASSGISRLYTDEGQFTDEDIDYLAFLRKNGATTAEIAEALNTKFATGTFGISADTEQKVNDLFKYAEKSGLNSKTGIDAMMAAYKLIADETVGKASPFEKFEAWRYLAMLGNTKTMMRNAVGNVLFNATTNFSNGLSALIESGVDKALKAATGKGIQRQKAILNPTKDAGLIKTAWDDGTQNRWSEISGTKYEKSTKDVIKRQKSVFDSKLLRLYEKATDMGISDTGFVHTKYSTSLAGYLKANGLDEDAFRAEQRYNRLKQDSQTRLLTDYEKAEMENLKGIVDTLEKGRDYAVKQAEYSTFHEDNALAQWLSKNIQEARGSDNLALRTVGTIAEGVLPFKKTPANILKSGFEFSPLGAINSIAKTGKLVYENTGKRKNNLADTYQVRNKITGKLKDVDRSLASDVIESWAKTMTGSMLAMFGYYLADKGILRAGGKGDKYQNDLEGKQEYSIEINGKTYTVDWAAPAVMPMLLGAEAQNITQKNLVPSEAWYKDIDKTVGTLNALLDPILETSFMQGVQNALESAANQVKYKNDEDGTGDVIGGIAGAFASNALTSYLTQGVPTFSGQIARTVDPIRRATDTSTDSNFLAEWEKTARKTANKIPFLSKFVNEPYYDAAGRTQKNSPYDNPIANFAYQALSPAYVSDIKETAADKSARKAYEGLVPVVGKDGKTTIKPVHDSKVFASWKNKVTIGDEKLDPKQMAEYRKTTGHANQLIRTALAKEEWFNNLSPTDQTDLLKKVNTLVDKIGKSPYAEQTGKDYEVYENGGVPSLLDYYKNKNAKEQVTEKTGLSSSSNANKAIVEQIDKGNQEVADKMIDDATVIKNAGLTKPGPTAMFYANTDVYPNMTADEFAKMYKTIDTNSNQGITVDEIVAYLNRTNKSKAEGEKVWKKFKPGSAKKVPQVTTENKKNVWKKAK